MKEELSKKDRGMGIFRCNNQRKKELEKKARNNGQDNVARSQRR